MNIGYFNEYIKYEQMGLKSKTKECLKYFINSFENYKEKELWTIEYLPKLEFNENSRIRNELYEEIIFPVLLEGYNNKNIKLTIWMVKLIGTRKDLTQMRKYLFGCFKVKSLSRALIQ